LQIEDSKHGQNKHQTTFQISETQFTTQTKKFGYSREKKLEQKKGDLLIFGLDRDFHPPHGNSLEDTLKFADDNLGVVIGTELFSRSTVGETLMKNPKLLEYFDAIQVHDAQLSPWQNRATQRFYDEVKGDFPNLGQISCTDNHHWKPGVSYTIVDAINPSAIRNSADAIEEFRNRIRGSIAKENLHKSYDFLGATHHIGALAYCIGASKLGITPGDEQAHLLKPIKKSLFKKIS